MTTDTTNGSTPQTTTNVYAAIAWVQGQLARKGISKDNKNQQQGYKFRGIDDVYNALAPLLSEAGLCILPRVLHREVTETTTTKGGKLFYVVLDMEFDLVGIDGSMHTVKTCGEAMDSGDKATNKAMSAAYKYACLQTFCIPTQGDNDADATTHEVANYTQEQYDQFHKLVKDGDALAFTAFADSLSVNEYTALYNSFEQGTKVESKKKVDALHNTGRDLITQYVDNLREAASNNDTGAIAEIIQEIGDSPAKAFIWNQLSADARAAIRESVKEVA